MSITVIDKTFFEVVGDFEIMSFEILPILSMDSDKILVTDKYMNFFAFDYATLASDIKSGKPNAMHEIWSGNFLDQIKAQNLFYTDQSSLEKTLTMQIEDGG